MSAERAKQISKMGNLIVIAEMLVDAAKRVEDLELELSQAKANLRTLREDTVPSLMHEFGLKEFVLESGEKLTIRQDVYASIPKENKAAAMAWLEQNNFGGLIKTEVKAAFSRGDLPMAKDLLNELLGRRIEAALEANVHPQTLAAFLRGQIKEGANIPLDLFGATPIWTTKITRQNED